jgi:hypothetical protein
MASVKILFHHLSGLTEEKLWKPSTRLADIQTNIWISDPTNMNQEFVLIFMFYSAPNFFVNAIFICHYHDLKE